VRSAIGFLLEMADLTARTYEASSSKGFSMKSCTPSRLDESKLAAWLGIEEVLAAWLRPAADKHAAKGHGGSRDERDQFRHALQLAAKAHEQPPQQTAPPGRWRVQCH
jgi:hypothetical protein